MTFMERLDIAGTMESARFPTSHTQTHPLEDSLLDTSTKVITSPVLVDEDSGLGMEFVSCFFYLRKRFYFWWSPSMIPMISVFKNNLKSRTYM